MLATTASIVGIFFDGTQMPRVLTISILCTGLFFAYFFLVHPLGKVAPADWGSVFSDA